MQDQDWLTVSAAARRMGISRQAIQQKIRKNQVDHHHDNRGNPLVRIPAGVQEGVQAIPPVIPASACASQLAGGKIPSPPPPAAAAISVSEALAMIAAERAHGAAETARQCAELKAAHREHITGITAQGALERALWLERIDAAEIRAERVEERLDQILDQLLADRRHKPWWRIW